MKMLSFLRRRVPVILQMNATECGAVALTMVARYHGYDVGVRDVREICNIGRDGVTARTITQAARQLGMRVRSYRAELHHVVQLPLPAIIHWNFNHFVVLEKIHANGADIIDPAQGRRRVSIQAFREAFTGIVITLERGNTLHKISAKPQPFWWRYLRYLFTVPQARSILLQIVIALLGLQVVGLSIPALTQVLVDETLPVGAFNLMTILGLGLFLTLLTQGIISAVRLLLLMRLQVVLDTQVMLGFFEHLLSLPYRFFQQHASGDLLMRVSSNVLIREMLSNRVLNVIFDALFALSYLLILTTLSIPFALATLSVGVLQAVILLSTMRRVGRLNQQHVNAQAQAQSYMVEVLNGIATIKASGGLTMAYNQWTDLFFKELHLGIQRNTLTGAVELLMSALRLFSPLILLWFGAWFVLNQQISLGQLLAWNALASGFLLPISAFINAGQQMQLIGTYLSRIADVVDTEADYIPDNPVSLTSFAGNIRLEDVSFRYTASGPDTLQNISLIIGAGEKIALVGATGSGKSTLAALLVGLHRPTSGEIYYDDHPASCLNPEVVREHFGVVLQDNFLFNSSLRANISFYKPQTSLEKIMEAAQHAAIHKDIVQMPMGYETIVGENGAKLSGGQRQRVAIARAVLHKPKVLLLDEATSHLDTATEAQVDTHLSQLDCTRIVIAHRLSTIINADQIICLKDGQIVEQGTHDRLMATRGYYFQLYQNNIIAKT
jgi:ABC-type bacteriocin/lantibiotic exporter with double-glycine peptidase domain